MIKTPVSILQEKTMKMSEVPEYQCVAQIGPQHLSVFQYECQVRGRRVRAEARSKKEAKQEAARKMLELLESSETAGETASGGAGGEPGGPAGGRPALPPAGEAPPAASYVALLSELCSTYGLPAAEYTLIGDTGPPHQRQFTVQASVGQHSRRASASTKKAARQLAAHDLYRYLKENLSTLTSDFDEKEALARVHEKVMERYVEARGAAPARDLSKRLDDCPRNIFADLSEEKRSEMLSIIESCTLEGGEPGQTERAAEAAAAAGGLRAAWGAAGGTAVLRLGGGQPALAAAGGTRAQAAAAALRLMRLAIHN